MEIIQLLTDNVPQLIELAVKVVGAFAIIATMTANSSDNKVANMLLRFINLLAANFGKSKNK